MSMNIEPGLKVHNQMVCLLEPQRLVVESYCVRNWTLFLSVPCGEVSSFVKPVALLRL